METDKFYKVGVAGLELVEIKDIKIYRVPGKELVNIFTDTKTIITNGVLASTVTREDNNELWHGVAKKICGS